uniref:Uncharacterized protein n=1 Tax=Timema genevievae TaxID=629358 RepID=A0A7R9PHX8_TIMGE|nr:unnamed protein product [Timema genevievae]
MWGKILNQISCVNEQLQHKDMTVDREVSHLTELKDALQEIRDTRIDVILDEASNICAATSLEIDCFFEEKRARKKKSLTLEESEDIVLTGKQRYTIQYDTISCSDMTGRKRVGWRGGGRRQFLKLRPCIDLPPPRSPDEGQERRVQGKIVLRFNQEVGQMIQVWAHHWNQPWLVGRVGVTSGFMKTQLGSVLAKFSIRHNVMTGPKGELRSGPAQAFHAP